MSAFGSAVGESGLSKVIWEGGGKRRIEPLGIRASHKHRFISEHSCRPRPARQTRPSDVLHYITDQCSMEGVPFTFVNLPLPGPRRRLAVKDKATHRTGL